MVKVLKLLISCYCFKEMVKYIKYPLYCYPVVLCQLCLPYPLVLLFKEKADKLLGVSNISLIIINKVGIVGLL